METIKEKIDLLDLPEDERTKLEEKFAPSLAYVSIDEMKAGIDVLNRKGEKITKARDVKVLTNPASKIEKNYEFIEEAHEPDIYVGNIHAHNCQVIDVLKRINFCKQYNIPYKNEDGTYKDFLFHESMFQNEIKSSNIEMDNNTNETIDLNNSNPVEVNVPEIEMEDSEVKFDDVEHQDIRDYIQAETDLNNIESQTTTFAAIKNDLEKELAKLDALRAQSDSETQDNVFHFNDYADIEGETYSVGRGR